MLPAVRTAVLGAVLLAVGGLFDAEPLYVAGLAFAVLGLGAAAWVAAAAAGAGLERTVAERTVEEEQPLEVRLTARAGALPFPGGRVEEPLLEEPAPLPVGRRRHRIRIQARFARRGRRELPGAALSVADPLGLARRTLAGGESQTVLVLPRIHPVSTPGGWGSSLAGRTSSALLVAAESEVDGLRPYRPGSPASRIHWQTVARGHPMMERRLRAELDGRPLVVLDTRGPAETEAVDAAVRAAASLCLHLARAGGCALLLPGERRPITVDPDLAAWPATHVRLALVEGGRAPTFAGTRSGPVLYVAARLPGSTAGTIPRALRETAGPRLLVVPTAAAGGSRLAASEPSIEVAGCRGYPVERLVGRRDARRAVPAAPVGGPS